MPKVMTNTPMLSEKQRFIYELLQKYPMTAVELVQQLNLERFENYSCWTPANLTHDFARLKKLNLIRKSGERRKVRRWGYLGPVYEAVSAEPGLMGVVG